MNTTPNPRPVLTTRRERLFCLGWDEASRHRITCPHDIDELAARAGGFDVDQLGDELAEFAAGAMGYLEGIDPVYANLIHTTGTPPQYRTQDATQ